MHRVKHFSSRYIVAVSVLVAAGIFILDLSLPLGVAGGVPYLALVLISLYSPWRHYAFLLAMVGTGLTILGYYFSSPAGFPWMVVTNRFLALLVIWLTALFCRQRKLAEEALQLQATISENIAEGIYLIGLDDGIIKHANPRFERMFGYDVGEMVGKYVAIVNAPTEKSPEETKSEIVGILRETGEWHGEVQNIKKDGTAFWCYANVSLFDHPEYGRVIVSVHTDINERKQTEEELREIRSRLEEQLFELDQLYATSPLGLCLVDKDLRYVRINKKLADTNGKSVDEHIGRTIRELVPEIADQAEPMLLQVIESSNAILDIEVHGTTPAEPEVERDWMVSYYPLKSTDDSVVGVGTIVQDITERKQAEEELRESEEQKNSILDNSTTVIYLKDVKGRYLFINSRYEELFHITRDEIVGKTDHDIFSSQIADELQANDRKVLDQREVVEFEENVPQPDGDVRTYISIKFPLYNTEGIVYGICGISTDITERKQAEEALREREQEYRTLIESSHEAVFSKDRNGRYHTINLKTAVGLGGTCIEDIVGKTDYNLMPKEKADALRRVDEQVMENDEAIDVEEVVRNTQGEEKVYLSHKWPIYDREGEVNGIACFAMDITERKQLEKTAQISLSLQRVRNEILQMENEGDWGSIIGRLDKELRKWVEYSNCGINIIDVSTNRWDDYILFDGVLKHIEREVIDPLMRRTLETGEPHYRTNPEGLSLWPESEQKLRSVVDVPFHGGTLAINSTEEDAFDQRDFHILERFAQAMAEGVRRLKDLSELASREEKLRQAQKMEAVGQLTAGIAHNFNNKLMVVLNCFEHALLKGTFDSEILAQGQEAANKAAEIVTQLMLFSRAETASERHSVQIKEIVREVVAIGQKIFDRKIALLDEVPEDLPRVSGDKNQLEQVFLNLLLNARDALEEGAPPRPISALKRPQPSMRKRT